MWDLNFETWISHKGFTVAFGQGHPLVYCEGMIIVNNLGIFHALK
jgi:hypothetical protein